MKITKKELSESIQEGINKSFVGVFLKSLYIATIIVVCIGVILFIYSINSNDKEDYAVASNSYCQQSGLEELECSIIVGNETSEETSDSFIVCGYQEANAIYNQIKEAIEYKFKDTKILDYTEIKYMECNPR